MKYLLILLGLLWSAVHAQSSNSIAVHRVAAAPNIDGKLGDQVWEGIKPVGQFFQQFPSDSVQASFDSEVKILFDDQFLYIGVKCFHSPDVPMVVSSLKRDFSFHTSDNFTIILDPYNDFTNGFAFSTSPLGVQREGLIQYGGNGGVSTAWDNKWYVETDRTSTFWSAEFKIPFKSFRYNANVKEWRINFARNNLGDNEKTVWSRVPVNQNVATLANSGRMVWPELPPKPNSNIVLIPYVIGSHSADYTTTEPSTNKPNVGADIKIGLSSSLNLDLTVNPDFSQVDVDQQVTNLSRFSLFFPERRQFFLENSDLFSRFGFRQIRPFFSRRIGLHEGNQVPILAGARLSGKVGNAWRIGLMDIQTEGIGDLALGGQNYAVAAVERKTWGNSNISAIVINRQGFEGSKILRNDYNRVYGVDYNLANKSNTVRGKLFFHLSDDPDAQGKNYAHASWLMLNKRKIQLHWNHEYVGENHLADVGFVPRIQNYNPETEAFERKSYWRFEPIANFNFFPKSGPIFRHGPRLYASHYYNDLGEMQERNHRFAYRVLMKNLSEYEVSAYQTSINLLFDTDVSFSGLPTIPKGIYHFGGGRIRYQSDPRKLLTFEGNMDYGSYYTGSKFTVQSRIAYRVQPWGSLSLRGSQNEIDLPGVGHASLTLIGPQIEVSFNKALFWTTFIQYNTQADNVNLNTRIQWRFKPMSDFFLVYTDNYFPEIMAVKNRALVLKLVYWLNV